MLPVTECLADLVAAVQASTPVVLKAPPGAGKTTGVPPALLDAGVGDEGRILLIQPRRMAARAAASRLATLRHTALGSEVGYHVRFDKCFGRSTKLIAMTTGVLLRRLTVDPLLEGVACVILDEFHERSIEMDLAMGMLHRIRTTLRPELKTVIMSATLDPEPIIDFLGEAKAIESEGRSYPVDIRYAASLSRQPIDHQVAEVLPEVLDGSGGDVLVFLPGVGEIRRVHRALEARRFGDQAILMQLYGDLSPAKQDAVLRVATRRKIVLATNVAETSVTIPGVSAVIDSGTARVMKYDARVGLPKLQLEAISQASADQRAGRAGRTQPGICYRLWPAAMQRSRRRADLPEVCRCDFSAAMLTLANWGERDVFAFPWLTPPPEESVDAARILLERLDALDTDANVTPLGKQMAALPLSPRLARFMLEAGRLEVDEDAAVAAALLSERDPFRGESVSETARSADASDSRRCDVTDRVECLRAFFHGDRSAVANQRAARQIERAAKQILRESERLERRSVAMPLSRDQPRESSSIRLRRALLAAFPDRLARRRPGSRDRGVMVGGRGVRLDPQSLARSSELFLCIDVDSKGVEAHVRMAADIEREWIDPHHIHQVDEPFFDAAQASVIARRRLYFHDLMLSESPIRCEPGPQVAKLLAAEARKDLSRVLPEKQGPLMEFLQRVRFVRENLPDLDLPPTDETAIDEILVSLCQSRTSFAQLASAPWLDHIRGRYDYQRLQWIEQYAPSRMLVPSGNQIAIRYAEGKPPTMEVRIQEIFGWRQTPRLANGRVPIQLHLLGPNYRPQQITEDLANFWSETYVEVRKELRRRYPKHHWPEDPINAKATRNGLKPRS